MPRGDKPTTAALALKDGWIYEDALPADISRERYDWWFKESLVLDGVRMGPPLPDSGQTTQAPSDRIFVFKRADGGNSWHYERLEDSDVEYTCVSADSTAPVVDEKPPSDVDHLLFRLAAKDCERLAAGMMDCTEELPFADWCVVCQSRGLLQNYSRAAAASPAAPVRDEEKVYKAALETISESSCKGECSRIAILALSYPPDIVTAPAAPQEDEDEKRRAAIALLDKWLKEPGAGR